MKLTHLHLIAFGCFTDVQLDFAADGKNFHVIYGLNEAGKSTTLRALTGLFYGIPVRTQDAFLHEAKDLRIAAELQTSDGSKSSFVRRKGQRDTLLNLEGKPIAESLLLERLGGVSEQIFGTVFRLDHPMLVQGGEDLLSGKGE